MTKMGKINTLFITKRAENPYPPYTPNCNNVVIKKAKTQIRKGNLNLHCFQILYMNEKYNVNE